MAIFKSAAFSSIATDAQGVIQLFNVGAERMLGYTAADVMNKITPAEISDPQEIIARAAALSAEVGTRITPGFEALVFKASRGIEDIYELTYIRKDGSRFPAVVSVTALRDAQDTVIGYLLIGTDNTARKQAEAALVKAGALQSAIFNSANFSSIATDAKGVIQIFNVGAERMLGYAAEEVMGKITPAEISDPQEIVARATALSAELYTAITPGFEALVFKASRGIEDIYELTYIRKDGSRFPAVVSVTALRDAPGTIIGYLLIGTDNTARQHVEEQRRRAEELSAKFSAIVEFSDDAIISKTLEGRITSWNSGAEKLFGYTASAMIGQLVSRLIPTELLHEEVEILRSVRSGDCVRHLDTVRVREDGSRVDVSITTSAIKDASGAIIAASMIARDVTERKLAERALQQSEAEFRTLAEAMPQIVWTTRPDGWNTYFSPRWMDYTGLTLGESVGGGWLKPFHPDDRQRASDAWRDATAGTGTYSLECRLRRADGTYRWWWMLAAPLRASDGTILKWFGTCTDINERKEAEQAVARLAVELELRVIERTSQLEDANKELESFSYSVSHDLRAPLRGVNSFIHMIQEDYAARLDAEGNRMLNVVSSEANRMGQLIDDLLAFSRLGRQRMESTAIDMAALAQATFDTIMASALPSSARVLFELEALPAARGDLALLRQVFANLIGNAVKYSSKHAAPIIKVGGERRAGKLTYYVKDNGVGFDEKYVHKLFGVFQRLHTEAEFEGMGVGLAIVQRVIHRHGGTVWAESKAGDGATFYFTLPGQPT